MEQEKLQQMQFLEQNLQSILMQKQAFQMEINETTSALKEVENSEGDIYKLVGQLMIKTSKDKTKEELENKKKVFEKRLKLLDKQEEVLSEQAKKLREEVVEASKTD